MNEKQIPVDGELGTTSLNPLSALSLAEDIDGEDRKIRASEVGSGRLL